MATVTSNAGGLALVNSISDTSLRSDQDRAVRRWMLLGTAAATGTFCMSAQSLNGPIKADAQAAYEEACGLQHFHAQCVACNTSIR